MCVCLHKSSSSNNKLSTMMMVDDDYGDNIYLRQYLLTGEMTTCVVYINSHTKRHTRLHTYIATHIICSQRALIRQSYQLCAFQDANASLFFLLLPIFSIAISLCVFRLTCACVKSSPASWLACSLARTLINAKLKRDYVGLTTRNAHEIVITIKISVHTYTSAQIFD